MGDYRRTGNGMDPSLIPQFCQVAGSFEPAMVTQCLSQYNYKLNAALYAFFKGGKSPEEWKLDTSGLVDLFDKFAGADDDKDLICDTKLEDFFAQLEIPCDSPLTLALLWYLGCPATGEISRKLFLKGFSGTTSIQGIKLHVVKCKGKLESKSEFRAFYHWVFDVSKESGRRTVDVDIACELWEVVMKGRWDLLSDWLKFIGDDQKTINQDVWNQLLEFTFEIRGDLSNFEDNGAWPVVVDGFVEYVKAKKVMERTGPIDILP